MELKDNTNMREAEETEQEDNFERLIAARQSYLPEDATHYYPASVGKSTSLSPELMAKYFDSFKVKPTSKHAAARAERAKHRKKKRK